jgi:hypothetical protein
MRFTRPERLLAVDNTISVFHDAVIHMSAGQTQSDGDDKGDSGLPVSKGGSRIVTFRVSSEEFNSLVHASQSAGSRSLSAFARGAVLDKVNSLRAPSMTLSGDLATLTKLLAQLDAALQETSKRIRRVLGPASECASGEISEAGQS